MTLPSDPRARKGTPIMTAFLDYFPDAAAEVARISVQGNKQHNGDEPVHWARGKSNDHADSAIRHLMDRGKTDTDGHRHTAKAAWRTLAELQEELERENGLPMSRGSRPGPERKPEPVQLELPFEDEPDEEEVEIEYDSESGPVEIQPGVYLTSMDWLKPKQPAAKVPAAKRPKRNKTKARSKPSRSARRR